MSPVFYALTNGEDNFRNASRHALQFAYAHMAYVFQTFGVHHAAATAVLLASIGGGSNPPTYPPYTP
jgi:hypothetical protein